MEGIIQALEGAFKLYLLCFDDTIKLFLQSEAKAFIQLILRDLQLNKTAHSGLLFQLSSCCK
jgi:hypothetical protein